MRHASAALPVVTDPVQKRGGPHAAQLQLAVFEMLLFLARSVEVTA